jgi:hypothetical protein
MAVNLSPVGGVAGQFFNNNGVILSGGKIFTYAAGTTTNQATYTSASGGTAHANPIILDSAGRVPSGEIWLTDGLAYKFVVKDSNDVLIGTYDNIVGINSNFVNFTNEQELQTATAGQTVFTLTTMQYAPATNSLSVFVDGVNQYGPGALYAYVETDSTTVTFTTGLHVGAEVKFTTSNLNSSAGGNAFQVSYTPPFTGSATTNVGDKLAQTVSVIDFGAVGDGVADDTAAIQAAINAAQGRIIFVPVGTYLLTSPLELNWSTNAGEIYQKGTRLVGESLVGTVFLNRTGGYAMQHTVTNAQANNLATGVRMSNGELAYFTIQHDGGSPAGSAGIKLFSFWFAHIHDISVSGADDHALWMPKDVTLAANSDRYACGQLILERNDFRGSVGWGVKNDAYGNRLELLNNYVVNNEGGGLYLSGSGHNVYDNAIAGNGSAVNIATCAGIHIAYNGEATPHISSIEKNEIQDNWNTHIFIEGYDHVVQQNRLLQDGTAGTGGNTFRNSSVLKMDATSSGSALDNVVRNNVVRFDNAGSATIKGFHVIDAANTYNNAFIDNIFLSAGSGLTKYDFPANRERIYSVEEGLQVFASDERVQYSPGQLTVVTPNGFPLETAPVKLPATTIYDPLGRWDTVNEKFVVLYGGVLRIEANMVINPITTANQPVKLYVYKNGSLNATYSFPEGFGPLGSETSVSFTHTLLVDQADEIEFYGECNTASATYVANLNQTITFQML